MLAGLAEEGFPRRSTPPSRRDVAAGAPGGSSSSGRGVATRESITRGLKGGMEGGITAGGCVSSSRAWFVTQMKPTLCTTISCTRNSWVTIVSSLVSCRTFPPPNHPPHPCHPPRQPPQPPSLITFHPLPPYPRPHLRLPSTRTPSPRWASLESRSYLPPPSLSFRSCVCTNLWRFPKNHACVRRAPG